MGDRWKIWGAYKQNEIQRQAQEQREQEKLFRYYARLRNTQKAKNGSGSKVTNRERKTYINEILDMFARRQPIMNRIKDTLLTQGAIPDAPVALLQNTYPETICYMNSVLQAVSTLPGFIGAEDWNTNADLPEDMITIRTMEAFQDLLEAMRIPTPQGDAQAEFVQKQAEFYTNMFELTRGAPRGEEFVPFVQTDADQFRITLFQLMTNVIASPLLRIPTTEFPGGTNMVAPLCGTLGVSLAGGVQQIRDVNTLIEVAVPAISLDEDGAAGGFMKFLWDEDEVKQFQHLPDTLVLRTAIFGFGGKKEDIQPIVLRFNMNTYHGDGWVPINAGSTWYQLYAIVCHHGETIAAGHYTAVCFKEGQWWHIDDAAPSATALVGLPANLPSADVDTLQHANPYIFFYVREGTGPYQINEDGTFAMQALIGGMIAPPLPNILDGAGPPPPLPPAAPAAAPAGPAPYAGPTLAELRAAGVPEETITRFLAGQAQAKKGKKYSRKRLERKRERRRVSRKKE